MKTRQMIGAVAAILLASGAVSYVQAQNAEAGGPSDERSQGNEATHWSPVTMPDPGSMLRAGATELQVQTLQEFMFAQDAKRIEMSFLAEKAELALERAMWDSKQDEGAILQAVDVVTQARGELFKVDVASRIKMRAVLGVDVLRELERVAVGTDVMRKMVE